MRDGDFREGSGWGGSHIGWTYGGRTVQGLLSFYYNRHAAPSASREIDSCRFYGMSEQRMEWPRGPAKYGNCSKLPVEELHTVHFTRCQKPWACHPSKEPQCAPLHDAWWCALTLKQGLSATAGEA